MTEELEQVKEELAKLKQDYKDLVHQCAEAESKETQLLEEIENLRKLVVSSYPRILPLEQGRTSMTLEELIKIVDVGYGPDQLVLAHFKEPEEKHGDGLAKFICEELQETYVEDAEDEDQLDEAERVMNSAAEQLSEVASALLEARK